MTLPARILLLDAITTGRSADAQALIFEYMAATQAETGRPVPESIDQLPTVLRTECDNIDTAYQTPGTLLLAYRDQRPIGCVGLKPLAQPGSIEVKRLYVRPAHRGGIARILMNHAHRHAYQHGFTRLMLDVIPERQAVIDFYRRLGYTDTTNYTPETFPMIYLERPTSPADADPEPHNP